MDLRAIGLGVAFALMWSSAFTATVIVVADAPPLLTLCLRFVIAGGIAVALAAALGQSARLTRAQWTATLVFGICQNALYLGLNFIAMQRVEASLAAIVASTLPLWVALASWAVLGERLPRLAIAGLAAGFAGAALITGSRLQGGVDPVGLGLCGIAVLALTLATMLVRGASSGGNVLMIVGLQMFVGAAVLAPFALAFEEPVVALSPRLVAAFAYLVLFPGLLATLTWFVLVRRIGATRAATFHFLNPFLGLAIAAAVLGEPLRPLDLAGVAVIAAGILAVQLSRVRRAAA